MNLKKDINGIILKDKKVKKALKENEYKDEFKRMMNKASLKSK